MELRRALLLFAIVLALAAIASSIARPPERRGDDTTTTSTAPSDAAAGGRPTAEPGDAPAPGTPAAETAVLTFAEHGGPRTLTLEQGRPATVLAEVDAPAQVDIPTLGLTDAAEPLTPASFDVLVSEPGRHRLVLEPAGSTASPATLGTLKVVAAP